jgi:hypothetical protein
VEEYPEVIPNPRHEILRVVDAFQVTNDVEEYILYHHGFEVHLIDSPGFDDDSMTDHEVLGRISNWINTVYSQGWNIGGILYLYDVTRVRIGASGEQNVRILEELTGRDRWEHISLITTKWNLTRSPENELLCEQQLKSKEGAWRAMLGADRPAKVCRFINTRESALDIIQWHLDQSFEPAVSYEMADRNGPRLSLGDTNAGQVVLNNITPMLRRRGNSQQLRELDQIMGHRFDDNQVRFAIKGMLDSLAKARREHRLQQMGRWAIRLSMVSGSIFVGLITQNPAVLGGAITVGTRMEGRFQLQRAMKREEIAAIERAISDFMTQNHQAN